MIMSGLEKKRKSQENGAESVKKKKTSEDDAWQGLKV
jgi:hypothetical protein